MHSGAKRTVIFFIDSYRLLASPILPNACRFTPTCSAYAKEAVEKYGALAGAAMAAKRLLRCHPFNEGGYDPVA